MCLSRADSRYSTFLLKLLSNESLSGDMCYVANVGDSRAVLSSGYGTRIFPLSRDHKPLDDDEQKRITKAGGRVYQ